MEQACEADNIAREQGQPAIYKLKMLPEVGALLNRNTVQHSIVDPDTNFLQSVKFFLEPLNDGSLPAYLSIPICVTVHARAPAVYAPREKPNTQISSPRYQFIAMKS
jgi:hypothetical protein